MTLQSSYSLTAMLLEESQKISHRLEGISMPLKLELSKAILLWEVMKFKPN